MPPASRGFNFLNLLRRYSSPPVAAATKSRLSKLPNKPPAHVKPRDTAVPQPPRPRKNQFHIGESKGPSPVKPASTSSFPSGTVSLLERILAPYDPRIGRAVRFVFRILPWVPPVLFLHLHLPFQFMWVQGASMSPFLNTNYSSEEPNAQDLIFVDRYSEASARLQESGYGTHRLERGMVIVFNTPHDPKKIAVKRVVGLPGDRVQPMSGYGGDETETPPKVVVPWNHIWVEGDADDRTKSVDSNWYGPISKRLVIGQVKAVMSPWYSPTPVRWQEQSYAAGKRVEEDAVRTINPDVAENIAALLSGRAEDVLEGLRRNPQQARMFVQTPRGRRDLTKRAKQFREIEVVAEPEVAAMARAVREEFEAWLDTDKAQPEVKEDTEKAQAETMEDLERLVKG